MASLSNRPPKSNKTLYLGIAAVVVVVIVVIAVAGYLYMDGQDKQNKQRESLKQAFSDQFNTTNAVYASITAYPAAPNKNYVDDFRTWIDGYRSLTDNYTLAVNRLVADGSEYQNAISSGDTEYANITQACNKANDTVRSLKNNIKSYETEYQGRVALRDNASSDYSLAQERSISLYNAAWDMLQTNLPYDAIVLNYDGYLNFLAACQKNITYYNDSISLVKTTGETYRAYLKGSSYYSIDTTVSSLQDNVTKLKNKYADLQKNKPNVTAQLTGDAPTVATTDGVHFTTAYHFWVENYDWPKKAWNIVAHFQLIDKDTGAVRSTADFEVPTMSMYRTDFYTVNLECDLNKQYDVRYTIDFKY